MRTSNKRDFVDPPFLPYRRVSGGKGVVFSHHAIIEIKKEINTLTTPMDTRRPIKSPPRTFTIAKAMCLSSVVRVPLCFPIVIARYRSERGDSPLAANINIREMSF